MDGNEAAGFRCPVCDFDIADVVPPITLPQVVLRCKACGWEHSVEP
jgi:rubredoxin